MRQFIKIFNIVLIILMIFLIGFMVGKKYDIAIDENDNLVGLQYSDNEQKIRRLVSLIDNQYVDPVNTDSLVDNAIRQILLQLDPHTTYIDKNLSEKVSQDMSGSFSGIGIQVNDYNDSLLITRVLTDGPNFNNLFPGDRILKIDDVYVDELTATQATSLLKGGTKNSLPMVVWRGNQKVEVEVKKGSIPIPSVISTYMINREMGYIKLNRFAENSAKEVHSALENLIQKGMKSLVFDLRGNPGGLINVAEEIADEFLKEKQLIVYTQDKEEKKKYIYATSKGLFEEGKIYVLIDEYSASASEIIAGALQEYGRATLIGRRSFGKGLVQREISLGDGTRLRLTVARYYTPSGRSIQRPYGDEEHAYADEIYRRYASGELFNQDSIQINKDLAYKTPIGTTVYGGGGIIPDVFVPIDSTRLSRWISQNGTKSTHEFIVKKMEENRYNPFWSTEYIFINLFDIEPIYKEFLGVLGVNPKLLTTEEKILLSNYIKSGIAEQLFGANSLYKVWNTHDPMILRALELEKATP